MNFHLIRCFKINFFTSADLKDSKLSLTNKAGLPRRAIKHRIAKTKFLLEKSRVISRCTARTVAQVNERI